MPTWATRHLEVIPDLELPRAHLNGAAQAEPAADTPGSDEWARTIDKLLAIRQLEDDWDGQGSPAPSVEVVDSALVLALLLRREGIASPSLVVQGVAGDVCFDWQPGGGKYIELEVTGPYTADVFIHTPGQPLRHLTLSGSGAAQ
ncbi:MAG TPA: hypothetical protein VFG68_04545 [Fimbriiglobus sp.]|nr:hypothetical protein [Fimbriiglobus sp.]